jgi:hypothetical protein
VSKGRKLPEFRWDVYHDSYKLLSLNGLDSFYSAAQPEADDEGEPDRFLYVPFTAIRWPATPSLTVDGQPSPPWKSRPSPPGASYPMVPPSRRYDPMQRPGLFREFAALTLNDEAAVLCFARHYGHLGLPLRLGVVRGLDPCVDEVYGEALWVWNREIRVLKSLVSIWDHVEASDQEWLDDRFRWETRDDALPTVVYSDLPVRLEDALPGQAYLSTVVTGPGIEVEATQLLSHRDPFFAARVLLMHEVNQRLEELSFSRLLIDSGTDSAMHVVPRNLIGALWLQFAMATTDKWPYRQCGFCNRWFQVAPQGLSRGSHYCEDRCRAKAWRRQRRSGRNRVSSRRVRTSNATHVAGSPTPALRT